MPSNHLTEQDLQDLRRALAHKRDALLGALNEHRADRRGGANAEIEDGDVAEQMIEQDGALQLGEFDAALLGDVERALAKLDAGTYGVSEDSGAPIPLDRLRAAPWARRTFEEESRRSGR
jgi:DnaK suppressor protein